MRRLISSLAVAGAAAAILGIAVSAAVGPSPTADYRFLNSNASSAGSAPALVDLNIHGNRNNTYKKEVADTGEEARSVLVFPQGNGLLLSPASPTVQLGVYTIVLRFRLTDTGGWRRLVDFKHGTDDSGLYSLDGALQLYPFGQGPAGAIQPDTYVTVAFTRDASGLATGYVNGVQQFADDDSATQYGVIDPSNVLRFFRDNDQGDFTGEQSGGAVARIELFNTALSASDVAALSTVIPAPEVAVNPTSAPVGATVHVLGTGFLPNDTVHLALVGGGASTSLGNATAGADGSFDKAVVVPPASVGNARITAAGTWGGIRYALFKVTQ